MQYGCLKLVHFSKRSGCLSSTGSEILNFGSHCLANFQPILDCFIPKFKLEYGVLENIKTDRVTNAVVFNLNQTFKVVFFWTPGRLRYCNVAKKMRNFSTTSRNKSTIKNEPIGVFQFCFHLQEAQRWLFDIFSNFCNVVSINS